MKSEYSSIIDPTPSFKAIQRNSVLSCASLVLKWSEFLPFCTLESNAFASATILVLRSPSVASVDSWCRAWARFNMVSSRITV